MRSAENPSRMYTKEDLKQMPAGVYYQQVTYTNDQRSDARTETDEITSQRLIIERPHSEKSGAFYHGL